MGLSLGDALRRVTGWKYSYIKWSLIGVFSYSLIYPFLGLVGLLSGSDKLGSAIRGGNRGINLLFMYPYWFGFVFVVQLSIFIIVLDIVKFGSGFIFGSRIEQIKRSNAWIVSAISLAMLVYIPPKIYLDTQTVRTEQLSAKISDLPDELMGFRIAHISDLQADHVTGRAEMKRYIEAANRQEPDMVIFTGDLVTSGTGFIQEGAEFIGKLSPKYGVFACLGAHDYWAGPDQVIRALRVQGVKIVEDGNASLKVGSSEIVLTLVTNIYSKRPAEITLNNVTAEVIEAPIRIFAAHQPTDKIVELAAERDYDMFLGGHTHGGQVVFSLMSVNLAVPLLETSYLSGRYRSGDMFININNGLGLTFAPIRFNAPAAVTLIELERQ